MTRESDFESKKHVTKHLTLGRFGKLSEATRVNSWEEMDYLKYKVWLANNLTFENVTPDVLKTIVDASKYLKAYKSYPFGIVPALKKSWLLIIIAGIAGLLLLLYFTGNLVI